MHLVTLVSTFFFLPWGFISKATPEAVQENAINEAAVELIGVTDRPTDNKEKGQTGEKMHSKTNT